ncbi:MAG: hypothetical protein IPP10_16655 [Candidatus Competibacteraceae bacterium]|nr:hypothetical protein [Candidatus Competibacteraceae bacterium]MBK7984984.1 hypothetical protein [Candidatus Competibacteraceae bacterium]MBK8895935.1 hypothetical protein [Candidatus Competibacteraceae bacterium]MBK9953039.1 hypothetical protein [Candidatus Competibacteraceae bacterium]
MRVLLLLVVVAVMGLSLMQWLDRKAPVLVAPEPTPSTLTAPAIPTRPQDVKAFSQNLDRFMQDAATRRAGQDPER